MTRQPTPDIMADLLGPVHDDAKLVRTQLRYDYELIPAEQRNQVQAAAVDIVQAGRRAQDDLMKIGQRLIEVKGLLEHGQFQEWCETEFQMTARTARNMMNVAKVFGDKTETVSVLSDSAMYLLAAPSTPEEARVEVIEQAQATGKTPTKAEVVETIKRHQPPPAQTYLEVWKLERQANQLAKEWDMDPDMMREGARQQLGSYWGELTLRVNQGGQYRVSDLKQAINNAAAQMEAKAAGTNYPPGDPHSHKKYQPVPPKTYDEVMSIRNSALETIEKQQPAGQPMAEVFRSDEERELGQEIASRNAAADEAARQAVEAAEQAEVKRRVAMSVEIGKPMVEWTTDDWAKYEGRQAAVLTPDREERAVAKADAAFGTARPQTRNERIDALLHVFQGAVDALPELGELTGHYTVGTAALRELNKVMQTLRDNKIGGFKANE